MVSLNSLENDKDNIIKNFKPEEMEVYLENLVAIYYESILNHDKEKTIASEKLIEEAVKIYKSEGYINTELNKTIMELNKANELLADSLEKIDKHEVELAKAIVDESHENKINSLIFINIFLEHFVTFYKDNPSEELLLFMKDNLYLFEQEVRGIKFLLENKHEIYNSIYAEIYDILENYYSDYEKLVKQIKKL